MCNFRNGQQLQWKAYYSFLYLLGLNLIAFAEATKMDCEDDIDAKPDQGIFFIIYWV